MYHSQQHRMQNCQFLYLRESFGYNRELFVCPSCVHRVAIGRLRVCVGSILAFYQIREENRAKLKISYSCVHRVSKSARYDATLTKISRDSEQLRKVYEPVHDKTNNLGFRPGPTQTSLYSHRRNPES